MTDVPRISTGILPKGMCGISIAAPVAAQNLPNAFTKLVGWTANHAGSEDATADQANSRVTINRPGDYMVLFTLCGVMPTNNREYQFEIFKNQVGQTFGGCMQSESNGHMSGASAFGLLECVAGDEVEVFGLCVNTGTNLTIHRGQLFVIRLAG